VNDRFPTRQQLRAHVGAGTIVYRPLESFKYSNVGYAIVGEVIAAITGDTYEQYLNTHIIRRLGLTHTSPTLSAGVRRHLAIGYGRDIPPHPRVALPHAEALAMTPAAGLTSNVVDLCRYMSAQFLGNPVLLSDESKREMHRIHWLNEKRGSHYGVGYDVWKVDDRQIVGHGGAFSGFITRIGMDVDARVGVAVLTNALDPLAVILMNGIFSTLHHFVQHPGGLRASGRRANLARYEGRFSSRWGDTIVVQVGRRLIAFAPQADRPMDDSAVLHHVGGHVFKIATGSEFGYLGEKATFRFGRSGRLIGLSWGPNPMTVSRLQHRASGRRMAQV
jgi:CubicO group peptidase (beta-lactamase class C family)